MSASGHAKDSAEGELLAALAGGQAGRDRAVAHRTRRVVRASLGVIQDQQAGRRRIRALALAAIVVIILTISPLIWWALDSLFAGEHLGDLSFQFGFWVYIFCPAVVAAALVAGWWKRRS